MTTPEHLSPPEQPAWLVEAVVQVTEAVMHAAELPRSISLLVFDAQLRRFDTALRDHYDTPAHPHVPNAYWMLTSGLAGAVVMTTRTLDPTWARNRGAGIVMSDGRTGEVVDNPDGAVTTPGQRAGLAAARIITAIANDDVDSAMDVFDAALATDGMSSLATIVGSLWSLLNDVARAWPGADAERSI